MPIDIHYIYLLQEREFVKTDEPIYKIGKTTQPNLKRLNQYPKGSKLLFQTICKDCHTTERELLFKFNNSYKPRKDIGNEYFEGDYRYMIHDIDNIVNILSPNTNTIINKPIVVSKNKIVITKKQLPIDKPKYIPNIIKIEPKITINRNKSLLDGNTMLEIIPITRINALLKSNVLSIEWNTKVYSQKLASMCYRNETHQLKQYLTKYNQSLGGVLVEYTKSKNTTKKSIWGRVFPTKSLGLTTFCRSTRNTLIHGLYYDMDIKNAQISIISNICRAHSISCPIMTDYIMNRDKRLESVAGTYNVSKDVAKKLFLRLCFCGTFVGWCLENNIDIDVAKMPFIVDFELEINRIAIEFKKHNQTLYETTRKNKESKHSKNYLGAFLSIFLQEYELRIVETIIKYLKENTVVMGTTKEIVGTYEYDGIKLYKEYVDSYGKDE
jgi:hypothetical protein